MLDYINQLGAQYPALSALVLVGVPMLALLVVCELIVRHREAHHAE